MAEPGRDSTPYYQQVANILRAQIISSSDEARVQLPTERQLCQIHEVSRETVRKALEVLEADGLIERTPGRGTLTNPGGIRAWRKLRHARLIGIVTSSRTDFIVPGSFYGQVHQGIMARAEAGGYSTRVKHMGGQFPPIHANYEPEDPRQVLGVILVGIHDERVVAMHAQAGYPVVVVDYYARDSRVDVVVADCFGEGQRAAEFLLEQGHRHLFFLGNVHGAPSGHQHEADADLLLAGFQRGLRAAGVDLPAERILFGRPVPDEVRRLLHQLAALDPRPTAGLIFSVDTLQQFRTLLPEVHLACPQDLSLICKSYAGAALDAACLRCNPQAMGTLALELLLERAAGKREEIVCLATRSTLERGPSVRSLA